MFTSDQNASRNLRTDTSIRASAMDRGWDSSAIYGGFSLSPLLRFPLRSTPLIPCGCVGMHFLHYLDKTRNPPHKFVVHSVAQVVEDCEQPLRIKTNIFNNEFEVITVFLCWQCDLVKLFFGIHISWWTRPRWAAESKVIKILNSLWRQPCWAQDWHDH